MAIKVVVVDDSPTMRAIIKQVLSKDPEISVVAEAGDPYEAREVIKTFSPDVVTLDVEMPRMSGIEFLEKIMRLRPTPVIMISTLTHKGTGLAMDALLIGAVDCIGKPQDGDYETAFSSLPQRVKAAAKAVTNNLGQKTPVSQEKIDFKPNGNIIAIGSSTGGVDALMKLIGNFPENCPPTLITQHMPTGFTSSFSHRLDSACRPRVVEAQDRQPIENGTIYIAPGGQNHLTVEGKHHKICRVLPGQEVSGHAPSVDILFESVAPIGAKVVGVLLTGMGRDGATGLGKIRAAGGHTLGQDEASCVVYGMPRVAYEEGAVERQLSLRKMAPAILDLCRA